MPSVSRKKGSRGEIAAALLNLLSFRKTDPERASARGVVRTALGGLHMYASLSDQNLCNDKWLSALVDAMDEVVADRPDDICRDAFVPAALLAQLYGQRPMIRRTRRAARCDFQPA